MRSLSTPEVNMIAGGSVAMVALGAALGASIGVPLGAAITCYYLANNIQNFMPSMPMPGLSNMPALPNIAPASGHTGLPQLNPMHQQLLAKFQQQYGARA